MRFYIFPLFFFFIFINTTFASSKVSYQQIVSFKKDSIACDRIDRLNEAINSGILNDKTTAKKSLADLGCIILPVTHKFTVIALDWNKDKKEYYINIMDEKDNDAVWSKWTYGNYVAENTNSLPTPLSSIEDRNNAKVFWQQSNYDLSQIKNQINIILNTNLSNNYFKDRLIWLYKHLSNQSVEFSDENPYRFKNFIFDSNKYTAINLISGTSAPNGILYLINNNKIIFSDELGDVISIHTSQTSQVANNQLLIKTRLDGGTGSYNVSGIILEKEKNIFNKIAVYPIHGFVSNPGINLEYRVTEVYSDEPGTLRFVETITLLDDTQSARHEFGFTQSLAKDFIVILKKHKNKFVIADNPSNDNDPAFKVFANLWGIS